MRIGVIGINHRSATLAFRERFVRACYRLFDADPELAAALSCVVLPTCHRMEIYFSCDDLAEAHIHLLSRLRKDLDAGFDHHVYTYLGSECFLHLARVTSGLDSLVLGESEIQKQVKVAYRSAADSRRLSADMHYVFQKSLKVGKSIRSLNEIQVNASSLPHVIWQVSQSVFQDGVTCRVLFIGHSEINRRVIAQFLRKKGCELTLCTRQAGIAIDKVEVVPWEGRLHWQEYDVVICGTYHDGYLLMQPVSNHRKHLIFDLSVPRTVDPALNLQPNITLLNMDALGELLSYRSQELQKKGRQCEEFIESAVERLVHGFYHKQLARIS